MNSKENSPVGVGVLTVFMVLLVLTLSTFATLTLTSAQADMRLSEINADTVTGYYAADALASADYASFVSGLDEEFQAEYPISDAQVLSVHLQRQLDGSIKILRWQAMSPDVAETQLDDILDVWIPGQLPTP